jgi:hypothetical protein
MPPRLRFVHATSIGSRIISSLLAGEEDGDGRWVKVHVGADADTALIEKISITST